MKRMLALAASCGMVAAIVALLPLTALAHEHRDAAGGKYAIVVGFLDEPAFVGLQNGLDLRVTKPAAGGGKATTPATAGESDDDAPTGTPVDGLVGTLKAKVIFGDQTMDLRLEPAFGEPGAYRAIFFPMAVGDYTFHISGTIEGTSVDERFTSSPEGFASVEAVEPYQFPKGPAAAAAPVVGSIGDPSDNFPGGISGTFLGIVGVAGIGLALRRRSPISRAGLVDRLRIVAAARG
jgi:hypothetical protein